MIRIIAWATFREAVRSKSFLSLLALFIVGLLGSRVIGWISGTDGNIVTANLAASLQAIIGVLVAVATGTALVHNEVKQRTLYTVISRPLARWTFVVGKFSGLCGALICGQLLMLSLSLLYLWVTGADVYGFMFIAGLLTAMEVCVMAAISLMWTTVSSPLLAAALSLATYGIGHAVHSLPGLIHHIDGYQQYLAILLASFVPDLGMFTYRDRALYGEPLTSLDYQAIPYGFAWIVLLVVITILVFRRKQL